MKTPKGNRFGVMLILMGIGLVISAALFKAADVPDIFMGFYTGPLVFLSGGIILIINNDD